MTSGRFPAGTRCGKPVVIAAMLLSLSITVAKAGPIFVTNDLETTSAFKTTVNAIAGTILATDHTLTDIPGTPWQSDSYITETAAYLGGADSVQIDWTMQHLEGPHAEDVNPGPLAVLGPFKFTAAVVGPFAVAFPAVGIFTAPHAATTFPHQDSFIVSLSGVVESIPVVPLISSRLVISSYVVTYQAFHNVPEPSTLALLAAGGTALAMMARRRKVRAKPG